MDYPKGGCSETLGGTTRASRYDTCILGGCDAYFFVLGVLPRLNPRSTQIGRQYLALSVSHSETHVEKSCEGNRMVWAPTASVFFKSSKCCVPAVGRGGT